MDYTIAPRQRLAPVREREPPRLKPLINILHAAATSAVRVLHAQRKQTSGR